MLKERFLLSDQGAVNLRGAILACVISNLSLMLPFIVTVQVVTEILRPLSGEALRVDRLWLYLALGILCGLLVFMAQKNDYRKTYVASYKESENLRVSLAEKIRTLPMSVFNEKNLSDLTTNLMGDVATTEHVLSHVVPQLIAQFISLGLVTVMLSFFNFKMALMVFGTVPLAFLCIYLSRKVQIGLGKKHIETKLNAACQTQEYLEGIKVIKACNLTGEKFNALESALHAMMKAAMKMEFITGTFVSSAQMLIQAGIGLTVWLGSQLLIAGEISTTVLLIFLLIVVRIYGPVITLLTLLPELLYLFHATQSMRTLLVSDSMTGLNHADFSHHDIEFDKVSFSYKSNDSEGEEAVINHLSLKLPEGKVTALVGPSGSGKTTLTKLIARFWDPDSGKVYIGGKDLSGLDPELIMDQMAFVFQDVVLFNDTVLNNILIGRAGATEEDAIAAAKAACCDDFIAKLPNGYYTVLGENGATLSGGERQRLSIARAILKNAPIILLDEASASLDPENETAVQMALSELTNRKTVVVIAHRLRTIAGADQIVVLDKGKVVELGDHASLIAKKGLYAKLYHFQQAGLNWSF